MRIDASGQGAIAVTPSDTVNLSLPNGTACSKGIYVAVSGDLKVKMVDGTEVTFLTLSSGMIHPISAVRIFSAGTTATGILAVY